MALQAIDYIIVFAFFVLVLVVGVQVSKRAGSSSSEYFLSGRSMPWWLLGFSMVATTFSADTPNLVTDIIRQQGIAGNWVWFPFLLTSMLTVFVYAKLWRRCGVQTDIEFYELRYSGKAAAFLRGFRAVYLGVFFNIMIMATVTLAAIKIGSVMFDFSPVKTILIAGVVTVAFSALGGLRGVLITDVILFVVSMVGSVCAAIWAVNHPDVGGLTALVSNPSIKDKLNYFPDLHNTNMVVSLLIIPLAVQWWSTWYPGAEPGGGGYIAQRMLAAKNEKHATGATMLFTFCHYALRPWPWFIVGLASILVYPDLEALRQAFPNLAPSVVQNDLAYPAMLRFLPHGLLGLVVASLVAAYMSTMSTHLNWGSSYVVYDFYQRFVNPNASEKTLVRVGRFSTIIMMAVASLIALMLSNALQCFQILLQIGAGTGLLFILRWFWWRINAISEITAMVVSFMVAVYFEFIHSQLGMAPLESWQKLIIGVLITTASWVGVTFLTRPTDKDKLYQFVHLVKPGGFGWRTIEKLAQKEGKELNSAGQRGELTSGIICMILGSFSVMSAVFATGYWIYRLYYQAIFASISAVILMLILAKVWTSSLMQADNMTKPLSQETLNECQP